METMQEIAQSNIFIYFRIIRVHERKTYQIKRNLKSSQTVITSICHWNIEKRGKNQTKTLKIRKK